MKWHIKEGFSAFDFHNHSYYSKDSYNEPMRLVKTAKKRGLSGLAFTEHNKVWKKGKLPKIDNFLVIPGVEVKTLQGEVIGLFVDHHIPKKLSFIETVERIHEQNGIVVIPHPFDSIRNKSRLKIEGYSNGKHGYVKVRDIEKHVDLIEGFNARCLMPEFNKMAIEFAKKIHKPLTAGSDAHFPWEIASAITLLPEVESLDDLREALLKGDQIVFGKPSGYIAHLASFEMKYLRVVLSKFIGEF